MRLSERSLVLAGLSLLLLAPMRADAVRLEHPDFTENHQRPLHLLVIPPTASITRGKVNDAEPLIKEARAFEEALARSTAEQLRKRGYEVSVLSLEELAKDRQLAEIVDRAQSRATEAMSRASADPKDIRRGRFGLGDTAAPLLDATDAEGLVFLRSMSIVHSKGRKWIAGILNPANLMATQTATHTQGGLFDARDGLLLSLMSGLEQGPVLKKPELIAAQVVASTFRDFPQRGHGHPLKAKHRRDTPARDLSRKRRLPEQDVLAAFDALELEEPAAGAAPPATEPLSKDRVQPLNPPSDETANPGVKPESEAHPQTMEARVTPTRTALTMRELYQQGPAERGTPVAQVALLGDAGEPSITTKNMMPVPIRVSLDFRDWVTLKPGESQTLDLDTGSHRLLVVHAEEDREYARAAIILSPGRVAIAEIWPR